ncbi:patatin-like phospholipase RssA [Catenovulum sp. 2E275]|uniref:patatin-like phospholipase RssA n=1 Tax=Catenovulum sp. 2E275 TaxID=2980497 RepID=UPI0021CFAD99|nr:patatin-like phospholipase RssA [Catenovulum sp. 2E275]MCU4676014.1 patatin-like phospholipase RssA [Catenovulum sp. 2E275]
MQTTKKAKLGLALGSGAARGWSLIGILNQLSLMGLKPDLVVGCSIGSLVGAAYCTQRLEELETWVRTLDTWQVIRLLDWGMGQGGVVSGGRLFSQLKATMGATKIEDCTTEFAAVATELYTGREHVFNEGSLLDAIRASCAIPGVLAPQFINQHWMIDGAVVNPVPVSVCRAMGATHVIAIDLNSGKPQPLTNPHDVLYKDATEEKVQEQPNKFQDLLGNSKNFIENIIKKRNSGGPSTPGFMAVANGAIDIMQNRITRSRLAADPPDILIQPKVGHIGIMEFNRAEEAIEIGQSSVIQVAHLLDEYVGIFK